MKKSSYFLILVILLLPLVGCSSNSDKVSKEDNIPNLKVGYIFTNHHTALMTAASKGEEFKGEGIYLKKDIDREKYTLMKDDKPVAKLDLVVTKNGSETMTMMGQGHLDLGLASSAANIAAMDKGNKIKILSPVHTEGIGLVVGKDSSINNWDELLKELENRDEPMKIGYHSPTSAPVILFEAAIKEAGISYSNNPQNLDADILLVDLKGTSNLIPALSSNQVDGWVGPSPYPELSQTEKVGKIILDMKHLPPEGKWHDFPCCVASATEKTMERYPEVVEDFMSLLTVSANYSEKNKEEAAEIVAKWTGVSEEAAKMSSIKYTTDPNETWVSNVELIFNALKDSNKLNDNFKDKEYKKIKDILYNFNYVK
ncbi:ABC transporter substrate-binding protein [Dethiothermospora halolimnae]|uniref:ABC transporter substrate-binding protein n=1 Tax=Dethiothermospora halolimnae TaxID=3114390 RepID=UPI003CCB7A5B